MNFRATLTELNSYVESCKTGSCKTRIRWAIVTIGVIVNGAILFPTFVEDNSLQNSASVIYLPPATTVQRFASVDQSAETSAPEALPEHSVPAAQKQFALADALAYAGERDAAVEHYLRAMTYRIKSQSTAQSD